MNELISKSHISPNNQEWSKNNPTCETDIKSLVHHRNSPESEFEPSKESLNSFTFPVWHLVKSSRSASWQLLLIALICRNAAFYASSSKIVSYRFSIISCIGQELSWSAYWPSSAGIDSYGIDDLSKSLAIMFIACSYNYCKRKWFWTNSCMSLYSLASLVAVILCRFATFFESISVLSTANVTRLSLPIA